MLGPFPDALRNAIYASIDADRFASREMVHIYATQYEIALPAADRLSCGRAFRASGHGLP
jgi:hypothetical protein